MSNRKVVIMSGIPGSGKSTYIKKTYPLSIICSADHYMVDSRGNYLFDPSKLSMAHGRCLVKFVAFIGGDNTRALVVDNCNLSYIDMAPYVDLALAFSISIEIITFECDPETAYKRGKHGVPMAALLAMARKLNDSIEETPPPHWNGVKFTTNL